MNFARNLSIGIVCVLSGMMSACNKQEGPTVSYSKDIEPILAANCLECHANGGAGELKSGLNMVTHANLMKGTKFGSIIKPGDSLSSTLVLLIEGKADPSLKMPHGDRNSLSVEQIKTIKTWINEGALNN